MLHDFATQTSGNLYMAFMIRVDYLGFSATEGYNIGFDQAESSTNLNTRLYRRKGTSSNFQFGIAKHSNEVVYEAYSNSIGNTYLVVLKYMFITGSNNDRAKMYVLSPGAISSEPANSNAEATLGDDMMNIGQVFLSNSRIQTGLNQSLVKIDGIRVGTSWSSTVITSITPISSEVPVGFSLSQNYPNPFNPVTNINFSIARSQHVKIIVTDITGRQFAELVNEKLNAGTYRADFNGANLSSGTYFCTMLSEGFKDVKKMILVK